MSTRPPVALTLLLFCTTALAQPSLVRSLTVPASPLQAYNAWTVDWQMRLWSGARGAVCEARPGGVRRLALTPDRMEDGVFSSVERGRFIRYATQIGSDTTQVEMAFEPAGDSTHIAVRQQWSSADPALRDSLNRFWDARLAALANYLSAAPGAYWAVPQGKGPFPSVLVLHDRFGLNRTTRAFCDSLAATGFVAVAADLFRGEVTADPAQAARFLSAVEQPAALSAARRGLLQLRGMEAVEKSRTAVWGLGFGGTIALQLASEDPKLRGITVWYPLVAPELDVLKRVAWPILAVFGDRDVARPDPGIQAFDQSLVQAGVRVETVVLLGGREFADPAYGAGYDRMAVSEAWRRTLAFFDRQLRL
jgi:carboxymethylenebutenolidase